MKKRNRQIAALMSFGMIFSGCSVEETETGTVPEDLEFTRSTVMNVEMELPPLAPIVVDDDDYESVEDMESLDTESALLSLEYLNMDLAIYRTDFEDDMTGYEKGVYTAAENMLSTIDEEGYKGERIDGVTIDGHEAFCYYAELPDLVDESQKFQTFNYLVLIGRHVYNFYFSALLPPSEVGNMRALTERIVSTIRILPMEESDESEETEAES